MSFSKLANFPNDLYDIDVFRGGGGGGDILIFAKKAGAA